MTISNRVIVFGAAGGMGRMFLDRLEAAGFDTLGADLNGGDGVIAADILDLGEAMSQALAAAGMVILAVPDAIACEAAADIADKMHSEALLVDCTSVKAPYVEGVADAGTCGLVSINPLFGPGLDWTGRSVVVTELRPGEDIERLTGFLESCGLAIITLDAERHDALAAEAQAQLHAAILGFILSVSADGALFNTPPNRVMRMLGARILTGEPHVYWKIQSSNPFAGVARRRLITALSEFDAMCERGDDAGFAAMLENAKDNLGDDPASLSAACVKLFGALDQ